MFMKENRGFVFGLHHTARSRAHIQEYSDALVVSIAQWMITAALSISIGVGCRVVGQF